MIYWLLYICLFLLLRFTFIFPSHNYSHSYLSQLIPLIWSLGVWRVKRPEPFVKHSPRFVAKLRIIGATHYTPPTCFPDTSEDDFTCFNFICQNECRLYKAPLNGSFSCCWHVNGFKSNCAWDWKKYFLVIHNALHWIWCLLDRGSLW